MQGRTCTYRYVFPLVFSTIFPVSLFPLCRPEYGAADKLPHSLWGEVAEVLVYLTVRGVVDELEGAAIVPAPLKLESLDGGAGLQAIVPPVEGRGLLVFSGAVHVTVFFYTANVLQGQVLHASVEGIVGEPHRALMVDDILGSLAMAITPRLRLLSLPHGPLL